MTENLDEREEGAENDSPDENRSLAPYQQNTEIVDQRGRGVILVVDDDPEHATFTANALDDAGFRCDIVTQGGKAGLNFLKQHQYDLLLADAELQSMSGIELVQRARELNPFLAAVVLTSEPTFESAREAFRCGATDCIPKSSDVEELRRSVTESLQLQKVARRSRKLQRGGQRGTSERFSFSGVIGSSDAMRRVLEKCQMVAETDATALIVGETGTGKELIARAIHEASPRRSGHFVPINCAALSPQIIESELFGHEKGAFTGAVSRRKGFFEHSNRGTLFLDEVGDIPLTTQVKLLRVLENREIIRVGSNDPVPVDVRVLAATHRDLEELVAEGTFREDLYYRLKVVIVELPPLRERSQDIASLVDFYLHHFAEAYGKNCTDVEGEALAALVAHPWKGNVRELKHAVENLVVTAPGPTISLEDLPESIRQSRHDGGPGSLTLSGIVGLSLKDVERELIKGTLASVNGNRHEAAKVLGIGERTLYRKLKLYGLS